jgi:hypothetical protein
LPRQGPQCCRRPSDAHHRPDQVADCDGRPIGAGHPRRRGGAAHRTVRPDGRSHRAGAVDAAREASQTALVDVRSTFRLLSTSEIEAPAARASL